mmetsp:Transcript_129153/g.223683  ORF Transcript_129153/g.223683 Transcript_129153/m.223683 type:complete len:108 (+) Transcript_129153:2-325(+)
MTPDEVEETTHRVIASVLQIPESKVTNAAAFKEDLGVKLDEVGPKEQFNPVWRDILLDLEEETGIELCPTIYFQIDTVGKLVQAMQEGMQDLIAQRIADPNMQLGHY